MSIKKKIKIAVIGATGYTGLDLINILAKHPKVNISYLCSTKNLGKNINFFDNRIKKKLPKLTSISKVSWELIDLVFLSLPNGEAQKIIKKTFRKFSHLKYIDLSADFRINNPNDYSKIYNLKHKAKNLIEYSYYSISEFSKKKIRKHRIISNPGCYPTSIQLPLIPILNKNLINSKDIVIDSKSGFSGAGKGFKKKFTHRNLFNSIYAYSPQNHRHTGEIDQEFKRLIKKNVKYTFNPHLLPTFRGILSSIYVNPRKRVNAKKIKDELCDFYKNSRFIKVLKINSKIGTGNVINTNNCEISICETKEKNKLVIFSAIDNLIKGASGQAVQNMNLAYNYPEYLGLK